MSEPTPTQGTDLRELARLSTVLPSNGPRYTSYPTANLFTEQHLESKFRSTWQQHGSDAISLYVHVPFCAKVCFYCACNKIHTANRAHAETYLGYLLRELEQHAQILSNTGAQQKQIDQLHFGGGTPTTLSYHHMQQLFDQLRRDFQLNNTNTRDYSIELDPRVVDAYHVEQLVELGINRISVGIQDFDPAVQTAINRVQSEAQTGEVIAAARACDVKSVSVDLIYGLPCQTVAGFSRSLEQTIALDPDRIALYSYAHMPSIFKIQRQIDSAQLPDSQTKLNLLLHAIETLEAAGYVYLGMDHFAKRSDSLVAASQAGTLQRNFMGYTTHGDCDLLPLGASAIGQVHGLYTQNHKTTRDYYRALDTHALPICKGYVTSAEDRLRADVIQQLMCGMRVDKAAFTDRYDCSFDEYFAQALPALQDYQSMGLIDNQSGELTVTQMGRFFIRNICMLFDAHLVIEERRFSATV